MWRSMCGWRWPPRRAPVTAWSKRKLAVMSDTEMAGYERDPRLRELDVEVLAAGDEGGRPWARLSDTVLYPEGGGQPADRGWLGEIAVEDVQRRGGEIFHYLAS